MYLCSRKAGSLAIECNLKKVWKYAVEGVAGMCDENKKRN